MSLGVFLFVYFCVLLMVALVDPAWLPGAVLILIALFFYLPRRRR